MIVTRTASAAFDAEFESEEELRDEHGTNLSFGALSRLYGIAGQVFVIFVMTVAAAEAAVGLAIIISIFRHHENVDLRNINLMRG